MLCLTMPCDGQIEEGGPLLEAGSRWIVPDTVIFDSIKRAWKEDRTELQWSGIGNYVRNYCGQDLTGKRLMVYRGAGIGDQLIAGGICKILKDKYPTAQIDLWHASHVSGMWQGAGVSPLLPRCLPIPFAEFKEYDYHLLCEMMVEADTNDDQPNIWDAHFNQAGIDWDPPRVPWVNITKEAHAEAEEIISTLTGDKPFIFYQLATSTPIRSWPPWKNREVLQALREAYPDWPILVPGHADEGQQMAADGIGQLFQGSSVQTAFAVMARAAVMVCPDSCFGHASAEWKVPCVSVWAAFSPEDRVTCYPNHIPIFAQANCSPCRRHEGRNSVTNRLDKYRMRHGCQHNDSFCTAMDKIPAAMVVGKVREVLG